MLNFCLLSLILLPLFSTIQAGFLSDYLSKRTIHCVAIVSIATTFLCACFATWSLNQQPFNTIQITLYQWMSYRNDGFSIGVYFDYLTATMSIVVSFISCLVHLYSVGYMKGDVRYTRYFSLVSLFTLMMMILITANNFLQLFIGWEGVGLASYLLIGFWFDRDSAANASLKAFLVNRLGDFGLITGIALLVSYSGSLNFNDSISILPLIQTSEPFLFINMSVGQLELIGFLLFIGAMAKSAQIPLHVWLPDSMEGPTPISALIHAATMVTAGIYMIARFSHLYEMIPAVQNIILILGSIGALMLGLVGVVQFDIKRIIAYSTLSQLGYMACAIAVSAYDVAIFHLVTHAAFKALLFLAAGSVIVACHHEQDIRKMGGLYAYLPITYSCFLIGTLALVAIPPFSGFFSKDAILIAVSYSDLSSSMFASWLLLLGTAVTPLYAFRVLIIVFHGECRFDKPDTIHEPSFSILLPLIILAVLSVVIGWVLIEPLLVSDYLSNVFYMTFDHAQAHTAIVQKISEPIQLIRHAFGELPLWFGIIMFTICVLFYTKNNQAQSHSWWYKVLLNKYGFDQAYLMITRLTLCLSKLLSLWVDRVFIDQGLVGSSARSIEKSSTQLSSLISGRLYDYLRLTIIFFCLVIVLSLIFNPYLR